MLRLRRLVLSLLLGLAVPAAAAGSETATLSTRFVPDQPGASTTIIYGFTISSPNRALPSPLIKTNVQLPAGMGLDNSTLGLDTCRIALIESDGPQACPANSHIGYGTAEVDVPFKPEIVHETAHIQTFMGPVENEHLTVLFFADGTYPVSAEFVFPGEVLEASRPFGASLNTAVPLTGTTPEGPDVSLIHFQTTIGPRHIIYYRHRHGRKVAFRPRGIEVPLRCPRGGYPFAAEFQFQDGTRTTASSTIPCIHPPATPATGQSHVPNPAHDLSQAFALAGARRSSIRGW
jgi:hypothetical protein